MDKFSIINSRIPVEDDLLVMPEYAIKSLYRNIRPMSPRQWITVAASFLDVDEGRNIAYIDPSKEIYGRLLLHFKGNEVNIPHIGFENVQFGRLSRVEEIPAVLFTDPTCNLLAIKREDTITANNFIERLEKM